MTDAAFGTLDEFARILDDLPVPDAAAISEAAERNGQLTKPPGALGRLEDIAVWYAGWQRNPLPRIKSPQVAVFAGNHGVTRRNVSAYPAEVTEQMVENFRAGGAAINRLCVGADAGLSVVPLDLDRPVGDFTRTPAMEESEVVSALAAGWNAVAPETDTLVVGEMGIGNTTSASAIVAALFGGDPDEWVGRGTGVDDDGLEAKRRVVADGLALHAAALDDPLEILRCLGGREVAAMTGAIARARIESIPVILDGFICTAAAAVLERLRRGALDHCLAGHLSAESAHGRLLREIGKKPLLALGMRLGEGSGAALAIPVVRMALSCHSGMATFAEAMVSEN